MFLLIKQAYGLVKALTIKSGGIDTRIHDFPGLVETLAIKSGGIDTRIHDFHGLVEALAIQKRRVKLVL
jgi:hypothetical protein